MKELLKLELRSLLFLLIKSVLHQASEFVKFLAGLNTENLDTGLFSPEVLCELLDVFVHIDNGLFGLQIALTVKRGSLNVALAARKRG